VTSFAQTASAPLVRAISLAATLTVAVRIAAAPGTCGITVVPLHDAQRPPQLGPVSISADGRFLAFASYAPLLHGDTNGNSDIYVFDMSTRQLTIESALPDRSPGNADSVGPDISDDGRFVAFQSSGRLTSRSQSDGALTRQIALRDRQLGITSVLSANDAGDYGNDDSSGAVISGDGRVVAFESYATNLVADADANGAASDVYAVTIATRVVARISTTSTGRQPATGATLEPSISGDGELVAFTSSAWLGEEQERSVRPAPNALLLQPNRRLPNVFVRDLAHGTTRRISRTARGDPNGPSNLPAISADGRWVAFVSTATDFVDSDRNEASDVFLHDLRTSKTSLVSGSASGGTADGASSHPAISANGQHVAFESSASNLVCSRRCPPRDLDLNLLPDIFVVDRLRRVITQLSKDPEAGWMEPSRLPAIDGNGSVVAFSSRRPRDERDRRDDFDLFVHRRCE
jgi:Tol biopolymer transport system component